MSKIIRTIGIVLIYFVIDTCVFAQSYLSTYKNAETEYKAGNINQALKLYKEAYSQGDEVQSPKRIGEIYFRGEGLMADVNEGIKWLEISADNGDLEAKNYLGQSYMNIGKKTEAFNIFSELVKEDYLPGIYSLGMCYLFGTGTVVDSRKSLRLMLAAATRGYPPAQWQMAKAYFEGHKHPFNLDCNADEFIRLTTLAAEAGVPDAQYNLALIYKDGFFTIEKNMAKAIEWLRKAAKNGYASAVEICKTSSND